MAGQLAGPPEIGPWLHRGIVAARLTPGIPAVCQLQA